MWPWQYLTSVLLMTARLCKVFQAHECHGFRDLQLGHALIGTTLEVRLLLYTRSSVNCGDLLSHTDLTKHPQFDLSLPSTFIIHGFRPSGSAPVWIYDSKDLLLERVNHNVIIVDWNKGATTLNYLSAVENTRKAAKILTDFIQIMKDHSASLESIHLIGISLGAHISGFVGAALNGSIGRITALDPAGPQFTGKNPADRLDPTDAKFVDVVHTDMDALGYRETLGHIDFYPNGGADQPGCPKTIFSGGSYFKCDHQRSVFLFLESVSAECSSRAYPCSSYENFLNGKCLDCKHFKDLGCPIFGYNVTRWKDLLTGATKAYFNTNSKSPFCKTNYKIEFRIWNKGTKWGYLTIKLSDGNNVATATFDHASAFLQYTDTKLFAQFDKDIKPVKVTLIFTTKKLFSMRRQLQVLRIRLTNLERQETPLCRHDFVLKENEEATFKLLPCEESNF